MPSPRATGLALLRPAGSGGVHAGGDDFDIPRSIGCRARRSPSSAPEKKHLDVAKTLEFLETQGVTVIGYGTKEFPLLARTSGHGRPSFDTRAELAELIASRAPRRRERISSQPSGEGALTADEIETGSPSLRAAGAGIGQKDVPVHPARTTPRLAARA